MVPITTPTWGIFCETGLGPIRDIILYKKLMIYQQLITGDDRLGKRIVNEQEERGTCGTWFEEMKKEAGSHGIKVSKEEVQKIKSKWKKDIKSKIEKSLKERAKKEITWKKKMRFMESHGRKEYLNKSGTEEASLLLRVKLNMIKAKGNYGGSDKVCRFCKEEEETTEHLGSCRYFKESEVTEKEIRTEDGEQAQKVLRRFAEVEKEIEELEGRNNNKEITRKKRRKGRN